MIEHPITLRELTVSRIVDVTPAVRRVTLGGDQLGALVRDGISCPAFASLSADDHVKIFPPTAGPLVLPRQDVGHLDWPDDPPAIARDYTVRRFDAAAGELDLEVLLDHAGPGASWARDVQVGSRIHVAGPRASIEHPRGASNYVLVGDDAALPAIARFLDERAAASGVTVIVSVETANLAYPLSGAEVHRIERAPHQSDPDEFLAAVGAALDRTPDAYVWAACEFRTARRIRALLRDRHIERGGSYVTHYWRRDVEDQTAATTAANKRLAALVDVATPWVIRVAATIGLPDAIDAGADTAASAAARTGTDPRAVAVLLDHLASRGVLRPVGAGRFELTAVGELLLSSDDDGWRDHLDLTQAPAHMDVAVAGLLHSARTGAPAYDEVVGRSFWETMATDPVLGASFDEHLARWAREWMPAVVADPCWGALGTVVDVGGGSGALAGELAAAHPHLAITLVELAGPAARARAHLAALGVEQRVAVREANFFEPLPAGADAYVLAQVLHDWPDAEARRILRRCRDAAGPDGRVLVVERLAPDQPALGDHEHGDDTADMSLLMLTLFGARERSMADYDALARGVGLDVTDVRRPGEHLAILELRAAV